jgi:hypothetical protein
MQTGSALRAAGRFAALKKKRVRKYIIIFHLMSEDIKIIFVFFFGFLVFWFFGFFWKMHTH